MSFISYWVIRDHPAAIRLITEHLKQVLIGMWVFMKGYKKKETTWTKDQQVLILLLAPTGYNHTSEGGY